MKNNYYKTLFTKNFVSRQEYEENVANSKEFLDLILRHKRELLDPFWDFVIKYFTLSIETPDGKTIPSLFEVTIKEIAQTGLTKILVMDTIRHNLQSSILIELYQEIVQKLSRDEEFFQEFTEVLSKIRYKTEEFMWKTLDKETLVKLFESVFPLFMPIVDPEHKDFELLPSFVQKMNQFLNQYDLELVESKGVWIIDFEKFLKIEEPFIIKFPN